MNVHSNAVVMDFPMEKVESLTDVRLKYVESMMYPGISSGVGFLREGQSLSRVAEIDRKTLSERGITHEH